ncbi:MAG: hypothetical protein VB934_17860 [Polyangiaceae bacterium]
MKRLSYFPIAFCGALLSCVGLAGCPDDDTGGPTAPGSTTSNHCAPLSNADVMLRLTPTCEGCHGPDSNLPIFGSLAAFEQLLAYDQDHVLPGDPDGSDLLALLAGKSNGTFEQMPLSGPSFAALDAAGETAITMDELGEWITNLPEPSADPFAYREASTMRRLRAEQILAAFNTTLGLSDSDYFSANLSGAKNDSFPARSPDAAPASKGYTANQNQVYPRFAALGGPHWLQGKVRSNEITAPYLQTLVQMAQVRCRLAVKKGASDTPIFRFANRNATSAQDGAAIRENISYLFLRLLGDPPSTEEVDDLYEEVFQAYESQGGETAWTAVCASLVRDPRWMSF